MFELFDHERERFFAFLMMRSGSIQEADSS